MPTTDLAGSLADTVKQMRKRLKLSQATAAERAGVGLRFFRELEAGKPTLRMDKVNAVLFLFSLRLGPVPLEPPAESAEDASFGEGRRPL
jgi:y4mF family transcriptional regulator